jgi:LAO/AO transport system kinase
MRLSALNSLKDGQGVEAFWTLVQQFHAQRRASGEFEARRKSQSLAWMWDIVHARLQADFRGDAAVRQALPQTLRDVSEARIAPSAAARALLNLFESTPTPRPN